MRLPPVFLACCVATIVAVAGCGEVPRAPGANGSASAPADAFDDAHLAWQGLVACADCAGIDTRLRLQRGEGRAAQYQLVEAFLDPQGAEFFREEGRWERSGGLLILHANAGGVRRYRIGSDGSLVGTDRDGRGASTGMLTPATDPQQGM